MKTLQQVEPRIPISSAPFTITEPGSYYLTTNLNTSAHGVIIQCGGVSLDLMGFSIIGDGGAGDNGIYIQGETNAPLKSVLVSDGILQSFGCGLYCRCGTSCMFRDLAATGNTFCGIFFTGYQGRCNGNMIRSCIVNNNGSQGIYLYGVAGECKGNSVAQCVVNGNGTWGILLDGRDLGECCDNRISGCTIQGNQERGIWLRADSGACSGNLIADCVVSGNGLEGVNLTGTGGRCSGNRIVNCSIQGNGYAGIYLGFANENRFERNHISGAASNDTNYGIVAESSQKNLYLQNSCVGQTNNYVLNSADTYGPIVTDSGELPTTGAASHPWANFSR
ncbi:MAG: right-handed parallel beta-helix repeat-containing protein [Kiritimatiellae bacterium]|nr:right-handed parallel beta-helix repeat-containing protein [Kiritimatiellia bacterium]